MIIAKISWQNLRQTPARTLLTILAMGIAATLAVASLVGLRSAQSSLFTYQVAQTQAIVRFSDLSQDQLHRLIKEPLLIHQRRYVTTTLHHGKDAVPAVTVTPAVLRKLGPALLSGGRLPRTASEALVTDTLLPEGTALGDWLTLTQAGKPRRVRVVGVMNRYSPSYLDPSGIIQVRHTLPEGRDTLMADLATTRDAHNRVAGMAAKAGVGPTQYQLNDDALKVMGESDKAKTRLIIVGTVAGVLAVISIAALLLIYTSINLTVRAYRTRYGLLRSLGTTPKQLRRIVLSEALMLLVPAMILGLGFGVGGMAVTLGWLNRLFADNDFAFALRLTVDWLPLVVAAGFMTAVTLIAAARPAWRASRVSPIAAIRALDASPRVSKRRLRPGFWLKRIKRPTLRLALRNYRRTDRKATMMVTLIATVALFVGLTGFTANFLRDYADLTGPDIIATAGGDRVAAAEKVLVRTGAVKQHFVAPHFGLEVRRGPLFLKGFDLSIYVVSKTLARKLKHPLPYLVDTKIQTENAQGKTVMRYTVPLDYAKPLVLRGQRNKRTVSVTPTLVPYNAQTPEALVVYEQGEAALMISQAQYATWRQKLGLSERDLQTTAAATLTNPNDHKRVAQALKANFAGITIIDAVATNQESYAMTTMMRVLMSGFVALLALVSLATIVNHTFADLMASRQSLAMMQSIGTTPNQLTAVKSLEYAFLLGQGLLYGGILGSAVSYGLTMLLFQGSSNAPAYIWPTQGLLVAATAIVAIWGGFVLATHRLLTHQNIDALIRRV
ncbi:FtsX-like permease family protein [Lacticaseibacillus kribbianus]|uniref:ABC transporter permease n=1 Tax=Lacticaseibacillus kribbianus TaxID=2926292 RepID=UPI001CD2AE4E|nr:ABC transporter permease [Lacticaseibacillus kribbianus]